MTMLDRATWTTADVADACVLPSRHFGSPVLRNNHAASRSRILVMQAYGTCARSLGRLVISRAWCELPVRVVDDDEAARANSKLLRPPKAES